MAESFRVSESEWVHFSNGAVEALFRAWLLIARSRDEPGMPILADLLEQRLESGLGCRAFDLFDAPLPEELESSDCRAALRCVLSETIHDVHLISDVNWDDELAQSWRERLLAIQQGLQLLE